MSSNDSLDRMYRQNANIKRLVLDYNICLHEKEGYSFLLVLSYNDRFSFIRKMSLYPDLINHCYRTRSILTEDWFKILMSIPLEYDYYIYRRSYWGENSGSMNVSSSKTDLFVLHTIIKGSTPSEKIDNREGDSEIDHLIKKSPSQKTRKNLLIEENRVRTISENIRSPSWCNDRYVLDETETVIYK